MTTLEALAPVASRPRPSTVFDADRVPAELQALDRWTCWRPRWRPPKNDKPGRWVKVPCDPHGSPWPAPDARLSFAEAVAAHGVNPDLGIGFVFAGDGIVGLDLDNALGSNDAPYPWAVEILDALPATYTEVSASGRGLHAFYRGKLPEACGHNRRGFGPDGRGAIEAYDSGRYFIVTGDRYGNVDTIAEAGPGLATVLARVGLNPAVPTPVPSPARSKPSSAPASLDDAELLNRARAARNGHRFAALYDHGELPDNDWSRADARLVRRLAFWTGCDSGRIDRLYRGSALMRDKWDSPRRDSTYGAITIDRVLSRMGPGDFYDADRTEARPRLKIASPPGPNDPDPIEASAPAVEPVGQVEPVDDPHRLARLIKDAGRHDGRPTIVSYRGEWWRWSGGRWATCRGDELRAEATRLARAEFDAASARGDRPRKVGQRLIGDVLGALAGEVLIRESDAPEMPAWIGEPPRPGWSARDMIATGNALIHLPSLIARASDCSIAPTPALFATVCLPFDFDPDAPIPVEWLRFLGKLWEDDRESIEAIQDWTGYVLTPDTSHQKMLMVIGPPRSGKGTYARVLSMLLGPDNVCSPTLGSLCSHFGTAALIGKPLAVIADARVSRKADTQAAVERLLSISGEDLALIDLKYRPAWSGRLPTRFMLLSNETPALLDASAALANRFIVLRLTASFLGREDKTLESKLRAELPGILLWGIEGRRRLTERGYFVQPASAREIVDELAALGSPIKAFLADVCQVGPEHTVGMAELFAAWGEWCRAEGRDHPGTKAGFGRSLRAALPALEIGCARRGSVALKVYRGVGLAPGSVDGPPF